MSRCPAKNIAIVIKSATQVGECRLVVKCLPSLPEALALTPQGCIRLVLVVLPCHLGTQEPGRARESKSLRSYGGLKVSQDYMRPCLKTKTKTQTKTSSPIPRGFTPHRPLVPALAGHCLPALQLHVQGTGTILIYTLQVCKPEQLNDFPAVPEL